MPDWRDDDITPPPINLSAPRISVEPTLQGIANGLINTYEAVVHNRDSIAALAASSVSRDECAQMRTACPAAVERRRRPSIETRRRWWAWLDTTAGAITRIVVLVGMIASGAWWLVNEVAALKAAQADMRVEIVKELRSETQRGR